MQGDESHRENYVGFIVEEQIRRYLRKTEGEVDDPNFSQNQK